jgi:hypothetical protein
MGEQPHITMNYSNKSDLRLYARFEYAECAMVSYAGAAQPVRAMVVDIGLGGVQLRSKSELPVETPLSLQIGQDKGGPLTLSGHARYCYPADEDGLYVIGFKFTPASHEERVAIAEYVHRVFQSQWEALAG